MIIYLLYAILLLSAIPAGIILSKYCSEEIKRWRFKIKESAIITVFLAFILMFVKFEYKIPIMISLFFMTFTSITLVNFNKSIK